MGEGLEDQPARRSSAYQRHRTAIPRQTLEMSPLQAHHAGLGRCSAKSMTAIRDQGETDEGPPKEARTSDGLPARGAAAWWLV